MNMHRSYARAGSFILAMLLAVTFMGRAARAEEDDWSDWIDVTPYASLADYIAQFIISQNAAEEPSEEAPLSLYSLYTVDNSGFTPEEFEALMEKTLQILDFFTYVSVSRVGETLIRVEIRNHADARKILDTLRKGEKLAFLDQEGNMILAGKDIAKVGLQRNSNSISDPDGFLVVIELTEDGALRFAEATERLVGQRVSIMLGEEALSQPTVCMPITDGMISINAGVSKSDMESFQKAQELAILIELGRLPLGLTEIETGEVADY